MFAHTQMASALRLPASDTVQVPRLSNALQPPSIYGPAALTTAAANGAGLATLTALVQSTAPDPASLAYDVGLLHQLAFQSDEGLRLQAKSLEASCLFRIRRDHREQPTMRLVALMSPGDLMENLPLDFITGELDIQLDLLYMITGHELPDAVPDHDALFFTSGATDPSTLTRQRQLFQCWPKPVFNNPVFLPRLARDVLPGFFGGDRTICCPVAVKVERGALQAVADGSCIASLAKDLDFPVLVRPVQSHAGRDLHLIHSSCELVRYLVGSAADRFFVTKFFDYRAKDGLFRKYRIAFIGGHPYLCHMAVSDHWMVHYLNAGMNESPSKRAEEAQAMQTFDDDFASRHAVALSALHRILPFDLFSIDCGELPDGRLLLFEADTAAIIHLMEPVAMYPYKHIQMRRVFSAFNAMLRARVLET